MPRIRYVGPIVGVDVVAAGLSDVQPGDEFDVDDDVARTCSATSPPTTTSTRAVAATAPED